MATISRTPTVIEAAAVLGWSMTRPGRGVVHVILNDAEPDYTDRPAGPRTGQVRAVFANHAAADAAAQALSVPGGPWVIDADVLTMTAKVTGDVTVDAATDAGSAWFVTFTAQEVSA